MRKPTWHPRRQSSAKPTIGEQSRRYATPRCGIIGCVNEIRQGLLDLGLEDNIPLPDAAYAHRDDPDGLMTVQQVLVDLAAEGFVLVSHARWDEEPDAAWVPPPEAVNLLRNPYWYSFHIDDPDEHRVWFINTDNVRAEYRPNWARSPSAEH